MQLVFLKAKYAYSARIRQTRRLANPRKGAPPRSGDTTMVLPHNQNPGLETHNLPLEIGTVAC